MSDNHIGADEETPRIGSRAGSATSRQLGPVRTGHETPPNERRPSSIASLKDIETDLAALEAKKKDPLPPIGVGPQDSDDNIAPSSSAMISKFEA